MKPRIHNFPQYLNRRRRLRRDSTNAERLLWFKIRNSQLGLKFRRQHGIGKFIVDFYCPTKKLIIELDGYSHENEKRLNDDQSRQRFLENNGFVVLRYTDEQILRDMDSTLQDLINHLN